MIFNKTILATVMSTLLLTGCGGGSSDSDRGSSNGSSQTPNNTSPATQSDTAKTENGAVITIDVLANDSDADGDTLTITSVSDAQFGTVENSGSLLTYTPDNTAMGTETLTYEISDGTDSASGTVEITHTQSLTMSGIVTDSPLSNAELTVQVGSELFTTNTGEDGRYEITISSAAPGANVSLLGQGTGGQSKILLTGEGGTFSSLLNIALENNSRDLNDDESTVTKVTQVSTAQSILFDDYIKNGGDKSYSGWTNTIDSTEVINLAGFIKLLADNPDYEIPDGETTLSLFTGADDSSNTVILNYLTEKGLVNENGVVQQQFYDDLAVAVEETLNDPLLHSSFFENDIAGKTWATFSNATKIPRNGSVFKFNEDLTGVETIVSLYGDTFTRREFKYEVEDGTVNVDYTSGNTSLSYASCSGGYPVYPFDDTMSAEIIDECEQQGIWQVEVASRLESSSFKLVQVNGESTLASRVDNNVYETLTFSQEVVNTSQMGIVTVENLNPEPFKEEEITEGHWVMPVNTAVKYYNDGISAPVASSTAPSVDALSFDDGTVTGRITDSLGTYELQDGKLSVSLEDTTISAQRLLDTDSYTIALYTMNSEGVSYSWTGGFFKGNESTLDNVEIAHDLPDIWTSLLNVGLDGFSNGEVPTLETAFGFNINSNGTMGRISSLTTMDTGEYYFSSDMNALNYTWVTDGNKVTFNGYIEDHYKRQRVWELVNFDDEGYLTVIEYFNIYYLDSGNPNLIAPRLNVYKVMDWSELFTEQWAEFQPE